MYYNQYCGALGYYKTPVYAIRPAISENYYPMVIDYLNKTHFFERMLQVQVNYLGVLMWINIKKTELITNNENSKS